MDKLLEKPDLQEAAKNPFLGVYKFRSREKTQTSDVFILYYSSRRWYHINYVEGHTDTPLSWVLSVGLRQPHPDQNRSTACGCFPKDHVPGGKALGPGPPRLLSPTCRLQPPSSARS